MTCKEAEKLIPIFLHDELSYRDLTNFVQHIDECSECKEELTIQYLITAGTARLEDGNALDLNKELNDLLEASRAKVKIHKYMQYIGIGLEIAALVAIITVILIVLL